jgi:probable rRNA maturation factor
MVFLRIINQCSDIASPGSVAWSEEDFSRLLEIAVRIAAPDLTSERLALSVSCSAEDTDGEKMEEEIREKVEEKCGEKDVFTLVPVADLTFVYDSTIAELNETYRDVAGPTDVLSFPMLDMKDGLFQNRPCRPDLIVEDDGTFLFLGDLVVSLETAKRQAVASSHPLLYEVQFLTVHGLLHLFGYDHETKDDEERMWKLQREILSAFIS